MSYGRIFVTERTSEYSYCSVPETEFLSLVGVGEGAN